jgi:hypothetical protein
MGATSIAHILTDGYGSTPTWIGFDPTMSVSVRGHFPGQLSAWEKGTFCVI